MEETGEGTTVGAGQGENGVSAKTEGSENVDESASSQEKFYLDPFGSLRSKRQDRIRPKRD